MLPFLPHAPKFDFQLSSVMSMTVDPHKMGMAAIPSGGILFREPAAWDALKIATPYLTDSFQQTFVGTRSGAAVASAWAVFRFLGVDGYTKIVNKCMRNTYILSRGLEEAGFKLIAEPTLHIVAFQTPSGTKTLAKKLKRCGWFVSYVPRYDCIRVIVMPHVKRRHVNAFLAELKDIENL